MEPAGPEYSIVVPAFDEEALLPGSLAALRDAMAPLPWTGEVVVCDNNSTDGTAAVARAAGARVVFEGKNHIARARNAGAAAARGRWLLFVDADTRVSPALLREALEALAGGRACGGGSLLRMDVGGRRLPALWLRLWAAISLRLRWAAGSFLFVRRDAYEEVGGFPEEVYAGEEIGLSRKLKRWGHRRGMPFVVLARNPVETSGRKADWLSNREMLFVGLMLGLFPVLARSKRACFAWYRRPAR